MPEKFIIQGEKPLNGEVEVRGSKNAAGAILAASIIPQGPVAIENLPLISDILNLIELLKSIGVKIDWLGERSVKVSGADDIDLSKMDSEKFSQTRISVLLMGGLLSRFGNFKIPRAGGDKIGLRPISTHIEALRKLGAEISEGNDFYEINSKNLKGREVILKEFSVTATENLIMAATKAQGKTVIKGAAAEPHVQDLGEFLKKSGADIEGLGTHTVIIQGRESLAGNISHSIIPDSLEAGTFMSAVAITRGRARIKNVISEHLDLFLDKMAEIGVNFRQDSENSLLVDKSPGFKACRIQALPYPGFPTDLLPIFLPLLTQAEGRSLVHDPLYENRFGYVHELRKMGADIEMVDPHRVFVFGKTVLHGTKIESRDIRAGASLVIASLAAKNQTVIDNICQIDRGYEKIEDGLRGLGADIKRIKS